MNVTKIHNYVKVLSHVEYMFFVILLKFKLLSIYINFYLIFLFIICFAALRGKPEGIFLFNSLLLTLVICSILDVTRANIYITSCFTNSLWLRRQKHARHSTLPPRKSPLPLRPLFFASILMGCSPTHKQDKEAQKL
jgi:hypothetical protein